MGFVTTYKKLFEVNLYHHYFLDNGVTAFDDNPTLKSQQLEKFDFAEFLSIIPSEKTLRKLNGGRLALKSSNSGVSLFIKSEETAPNSNVYQPYIELTQNTQLNFLLYIDDPLFENYSIINAIPEIPYLFSNKRPASESPAFPYIDIESTILDIEDFGMSQTTYDTFALDLSDQERQGLFGIISLEMAGDDTTIFDGNSRNILTPSGEIQNTTPTFKIQFKNRSTIWNYRHSIDGSLLHTSDPTELPLVKNGIVGYTFDSEERPSANPNRLLFEKDGGGNIIKTISEIYIN